MTTLVAMESFTEGLDDARGILSRPPGADVAELERARLAVCYEKMMLASAAPGELWRIMTGQYDDELGITAQRRADGGAPVRRGRPRVSREKCRDCKALLTEQNRAPKDSIRCVSCARAKKSQYNQAYRQGRS